MNRALFDRNAAACESAKHPTCTCHCGGALHGQAHSAAWRDATWAALDEAQHEARRRGVTLDLFDNERASA